MQGRSTFRIEFVEGLVCQPATDRRQLTPTEVVVTMARPSDAAEPEQRSMLMALLSDEERQRLTRFHFERDRLLFLVAHALVRITLSRHASIEPQSWRFRTGSYGRPEIAESRSRLRFSLSRRHGLAACAVILDRDIGLDVECISKDSPIDVAERFFSPRERSNLLSTSIDMRARLFLEYWTLKEAYIKARGLGLSLPLDQFSLDKGADDRWRLAAEPPLFDDPERWRFWSWRAGDDHQMALAVDQSDLVDHEA
jgi:4'-phosphopantetheinyl transferase